MFALLVLSIGVPTTVFATTHDSMGGNMTSPESPEIDNSNAISTKRPDASIEWIGDSFPSKGPATIRVDDQYMDMNPNLIEKLTVDVFVIEDIEKPIQVTLTETNRATGIFEGTVIFSEIKPSSDDTLHVKVGNEVEAEYTYFTVVNSTAIEDKISIGDVITITSSGFESWKNLHGNHVSVFPESVEKLVDRGYLAEIHP